MAVLITGGAGFIGSNFIRYFLEKYPHQNVVCLDKLTYAGNMANLSFVQNFFGFTFIKGDICNKTLIEKIFKEFNPNIVVNFAAESHVDRSIKNPSTFLRTNVKGVQVLLDACVKYGVGRFHQVSTDEVYGDTPLRSQRKFKETDLLKPSSPYSASKAAADLLVLSYYRTYGIPVTISRSGNNYGPFQHSEKLIPHMIMRALKGQKLPVYGTGKNVRDWIYVEDHCHAIDAILQNGQVGQIYNIGAGQEKTNLEVIKAICDNLCDIQVKIEHIQDRKGHDLRYALHTEKVKALGWTTRTSFEEGIKKTVAWYLENQDRLHE